MNIKQKLKLSNVEEKYAFPIGRKTWQFLTVIALLLLVVSIVYYVVNVIPSSRKEVHISKSELSKNKIDLEEEKDKSCEKLDFDQATKTLKGKMPLSEWNKLGDSVMVEKYAEVEKYDPYYGEFYSDYVSYYSKEYQLNEDAVPNILNNIYDYKSLDSLDFCEKIDVLNVLTELVSRTNKSKATHFLKSRFKSIVIYSSRVSVHNIQDITSLMKKIEKKPIFFNDDSNSEDAYYTFENYIRLFQNDSITDERVELANEINDKISTSKKNISILNKHKIAQLIIGSNFSDEDVEIVSKDFFIDLKINYTDETIIENYSKYIRLFREKLAIAEAELEEKEEDKEENRYLSSMGALISFASILSFATILLLFSIQGILKKNSEKDLK